MKNYTGIKDIENLNQLVDQAIEIKKNPLADKTLGEGKSIGLLFFNPSLRTRMSTQRAAFNLGLNVMIMNISSDGWQLEFEDGSVMNADKSEHVKEAAKVMSQYCEILAIRSFPKLQNKEEDYSEPVLTAFLKYTSVPVVSLESATGHPLQALADMITIKEHSSKLEKTNDSSKTYNDNKPLENKNVKVVLSWANHPKALPQAVPNSFVEFAKNFDGIDLTICHPKGYELPEEITKGVKIEYDQQKALVGADFVYTKNWSSYNDYGKVLDVQDKWMIDEEKLKINSDTSAKFMHCLPLRRNVIASDGVMDSEHNLTTEQAQNRIYSAQVVLKNILENYENS
jgi:N-succinyl-L-ornithine transcarbamylase